MTDFSVARQTPKSFVERLHAIRDSKEARSMERFADPYSQTDFASAAVTSAVFLQSWHCGRPGRPQSEPKGATHSIYIYKLMICAALALGLTTLAHHRKLCPAVMTPELDRISSTVKRPQQIEKFYHKHNDHGATYFFNQTKPRKRLPVYRDRPSMTYSLTQNSTKLSFLTDMVHQIYTVNARKVIVFCD